MKRIYLLLLVIFLLCIGCSKKLILKNYYFKTSELNEVNTKHNKVFYVPKELKDSLKLKWNADTYGSLSNSSLKVYKDILFASGLAGRITAIDINSGKEMGVIKNKGEIYSAPVVLGKKVMYVLNNYKEDFATFHVYDIDNGNDINVKIDKGSNNKILFDQKLVYVLSNDGSLYAINILAKIQWKITTNTQTICSPIMIDDKIIWGNQNGEVVTVDKNSKEILYKYKISNGFNSSVTGEKNYIYIGDIKGTAYKISIESGAIIWKFNTGAPIRNGITFDDKRVFIGNLNGDLFCLNKYSGNQYWNSNLKGLINVTPLIFKDNLIQPNMRKKVSIINIRSGRIVKTIEVERRCRTAPIFAENKIFFGTDGGKIYAFEVVKN